MIWASGKKGREDMAFAPCYELVDQDYSVLLASTIMAKILLCDYLAQPYLREESTH